ncbi:hypothetical protein QPK13_10915 [Photorhabdus tasmaniensis]|uniref:Calcium-dependent cell adhesion molecule 1 membrane-binding domain-containing protein n=1 Tax=Photorhabdus tasmaniensis TaxID=1004159 RepID=A0ABX0GDE3_9GAMM|nr:hypothetical protein [Photorhabdus tasmaniensis]NHB86437.1 hypothetical protein [Photorhabdus tasmaniensis]
MKKELITGVTFFKEKTIKVIYIRDVNIREYIDNGSLYFSYDAHGIAIIDKGLNFPENLRLVHAGNSRSDFHIISTALVLPPFRHSGLM